MKKVRLVAGLCFSLNLRIAGGVKRQGVEIAVRAVQKLKELAQIGPDLRTGKTQEKYPLSTPPKRERNPCKAKGESLGMTSKKDNGNGKSN
ncbi:MAG TPA: hypothetical protein VIX42_00235 [Edaphobacter sp.]